MKDALDFVVWPDDPELLEFATQALKIKQGPSILFPADMFSAGQMRQPEKLHAVMRKLGYITVTPRDGGRWRWFGAGAEFTARWVYVSEQIAVIAVSDPEEFGAKIDALGAAKVGRMTGEGRTD